MAPQYLCCIQHPQRHHLLAVDVCSLVYLKNLPAHMLRWVHIAAAPVHTRATLGQLAELAYKAPSAQRHFRTSSMAPPCALLPSTSTGKRNMARVSVELMHSVRTCWFFLVSCFILHHDFALCMYFNAQYTALLFASMPQGGVWCFKEPTGARLLTETQAQTYACMRPFIPRQSLAHGPVVMGWGVLPHACSYHVK